MSRSPDSRSRRARKGDPLTAREVQILSLVAAGQPTAAVGRQLGISENTVKGHLTHVYKKTGALNRVQAVRYYLDHYTAPGSAEKPRSAGPGGSSHAGERALIERQLREIEARIDQLVPAASELERLQRALDALRALRRT
jgi:DNA-binding CsgD family transcriptional regulator